jgi:hypothetical protein
MPERRTLHLSTLLKNGHVLIAGRIIDTTQTAHYYDPTSSSWTATETMIPSYHESPLSSSDSFVSTSSPAYGGL